MKEEPWTIAQCKRMLKSAISGVKEVDEQIAFWRARRKVALAYVRSAKRLKARVEAKKLESP